LPKSDYFFSEAITSDLKGRTIRGGVFTGTAQIYKLLVGFAAIPILGRLLAPQDFGLVAMVTVVTGFAGMFVDAGLSMATVQRDAITRQQVSNLFWIASALGLILASIVAALAPAIAWVYQEPRLVGITLALSLSFVFSGLTIQHTALLRRAMEFRQLAIIQSVMLTLSLGVAIAWAWHYGDYWALVVRPVVASFGTMALTWLLVGWVPSRYRHGSGIRQMLGFGANLTGANFVNYFARNGDTLLIGWYWGATSLGYYERAYALLLLPLRQFLGPMTAVAIPALSRLRAQPERYRAYFRMGVMLSSSLLVPVVVFTAVLAHEVVVTLLGPQWVAAVPIFLALAPAALASTTAPASHWVFVSWGHADRFLRGVVVNSLILIGVFSATVAYGPVAMAIGFSTTVIVIRIPYVLYCFAPTPLRLRDQFTPMWRPSIASLIAAAAVLAWKTTALQPEAQPLILLVGGAIFGVTYILAWLRLPGGSEAFVSLRRLAVNLTPSSKRSTQHKRGDFPIVDDGAN